ncbi:MAG TPA: CHAP domain-containing protein, partial [Propionicimonas sp.]
MARAVVATTVAGLVLALFPSEALAFTWLTTQCVGFAQCDSKGLGNDGYENEYNSPHWGAYSGHNCTNYAAYRLSRRGIPDLNFPAGQGSAYNWSNIAGQRGYPTDGSPRVGDIAWFASGAGGEIGGSGHVAYVESVDGNKVTVSEDNCLASVGTHCTAGDFDWRQYYISDVSGFIHFGGSGPLFAGYQAAFQANTGSLWVHGDLRTDDLKLGLAAPSSPSVAVAPDGRFWTAFQANTGNLWVVGDGAVGDTRQGMMAGTSPSIAVSSSGAWLAAFQANTGNLFFDAPGGASDKGYGMAPGTSPAVAALPGGGYAIAFQANTGNLWVVGEGGVGDTGQGMMPGTSPSIAASTTGGWKVAFQANTGNLFTFAPDGASDIRLGMDGASSPVVAALSSGGYQIAFQANTHNLWVIGDAGNADTLQGMSPGTSPAIAGSPSGGYRVAFQANTGDLFYYSPSGASDNHLGMMFASSPCVASRLGAGCSPGARQLRNTSVPVVSGTPRVGTSLTATAGNWLPMGASFRYQWMVGNAAVVGATSTTYVPTASDLGKAVSVRVTASKPGYTTNQSTSARTNVLPALVLSGPTPTISGVARIGAQLTAVPGTWGPAPVSLAYQWLRNGVAVGGATKATLVLGSADLGAVVSVRVTG